MMIGASEPWANCQKGSEWFDTKAVNGINNAHYFSIILTAGSYLGEDDIERIEDDYHRS